MTSVANLFFYKAVLTDGRNETLICWYCWVHRAWHATW